MKISQETLTGLLQIRDYGDGFLMIQTAEGRSEKLTGSVLLSNAGIQSAPSLKAPNRMGVTSLLSQHVFDVLIVVTPTGASEQNWQLQTVFASAGIVAEFMPMGPACRTFNLIQSEGRAPLLWAELNNGLRPNLE
ncbi:hypothetical protein Q7C_460 [Methylophaga frappieri]|uniref:Uncharacterized protein n=1 Tax=Methylophaga frappieri (strain ATCC BAA-2434 / DSM 25690 / JAM7) TaxID=754477 RepID=I1YFE2_METFJ|nr:Mth938-like domain-containing protein [Methylophaga frappieri]AFJ01635.1 hypothetical protein Q7C_460 [Methylophaga frappieri]